MSEGNGYATRELMLAPLKRRFRDVEIAGWGKFRIRSLTELERSRFEASYLGKNGAPSTSKLIDLKCRLIVLCVVDADGNQILTNNDIEMLRQQDSKFTNALVDQIQDHCGFTAIDIEELEKNLGATPASSL